MFGIRFHGEKIIGSVFTDDVFDLTERIRQMVAAEVVKADPSIQTVAVTAEPEDVNRVYEISEALRAGSPADSQTDAINEIVRNATTLR